MSEEIKKHAGGAPLKFDKPRQDLFIQEFKRHNGPMAACRAAGVGYATARDRYKKDPEFAKRWDEAKQEFLEVLEHQAVQMATVGLPELVFYKGEPIYVTHPDTGEPILYKRRIVSEKMLAILLAANSKKYHRNPVPIEEDDRLIGVIYVPPLIKDSRDWEKSASLAGDVIDVEAEEV